MGSGQAPMTDELLLRLADGMDLLVNVLERISSRLESIDCTIRQLNR